MIRFTSIFWNIVSTQISSSRWLFPARQGGKDVSMTSKGEIVLLKMNMLLYMQTFFKWNAKPKLILVVFASFCQAINPRVHVFTGNCKFPACPWLLSVQHNKLNCCIKLSRLLHLEDRDGCYFRSSWWILNNSDGIPAVVPCWNNEHQCSVQADLL